MIFLLYDIFIDDEMREKAEKIVKRFELFDLVQGMISVDPDKRPSYEVIRKKLRDLDEIHSKFSWDDNETRTNDIRGNLPEYKKKRLKYDLERRITHYKVDKNRSRKGSIKAGIGMKEDPSPSFIDNLPKISTAIHDQGESYKCWAYAIATMLRNSLQNFVKSSEINSNLDQDLKMSLHKKTERSRTTSKHAK